MSNQDRLLEIQAKVLKGVEVTTEEYAEVISALREDRRAGAGTKASATPVEEVDLDKLFDL